MDDIVELQDPDLVYCSEPGCDSKGFKREQDVRRHHTQKHKKISKDNAIEFDTDIISIAVSLGQEQFRKDPEMGLWFGPSIKLPEGYTVMGLFEKQILLERTSHALIFLKKDE